ncbi:TPA: hypothetical protein DEP21_01285 [Patescibacteria group bacterium]|nr:hypothetical protein [Candidatus Gracilibacteria bacterium]
MKTDKQDLKGFYAEYIKGYEETASATIKHFTRDGMDGSYLKSKVKTIKKTDPELTDFSEVEEALNHGFSDLDKYTSILKKVIVLQAIKKKKEENVSVET